MHVHLAVAIKTFVFVFQCQFYTQATINNNLKHLICSVIKTDFNVITFCMSHRRREMYCGHTRPCVCVCLSAAACLHYCTDPDVTWRNGRECPLVVHYWADLQPLHGLHCYGNITRTRNVSEYMHVLALCLVCLLAVLTVEKNFLAWNVECSKRAVITRRC